MLGQNAGKKKAGGGQTQAFDASVLGTVPQNQPQRTLIGTAS
jgi:hypothetical protein